MSTEEISPPWAILATSWLTKQSVCWAAIGRKSRTTISASDLDNSPSLSWPRFASLDWSYLTQALLSVPTIMIHIILPSIHQKYQPGQILGSRWKKQNLRWRSCRRHPSRPPPRGIRLETVFQIWEIVWSYHSPKQSFLSHFCQTWRQTISLDNSNVSWSH